MPKGLPHLVGDSIEKCRLSAIAAVEAYNRPGAQFRTTQSIIRIIIAWTALFHAIFYRTLANADGTLTAPLRADLGLFRGWGK